MEKRNPSPSPCSRHHLAKSTYIFRLFASLLFSLLSLLSRYLSDREPRVAAAALDKVQTVLLLHHGIVALAHFANYVLANVVLQNFLNVRLKGKVR
jgi:hypothetical protein